jgi:predicted phage terminase large subunit-like protein
MSDPLGIPIEDRASGTQLIQELTFEGLHAAKRYEPEMEKVIQLHAQTGVIENGFVHLPESAHWLPAYVHELTTFPSSKYDDPADSTSQFLDWFKKSGFVRPARWIRSYHIER